MVLPSHPSHPAKQDDGRVWERPDWRGEATHCPDTWCNWGSWQAGLRSRSSSEEEEFDYYFSSKVVVNIFMKDFCRVWIWQWHLTWLCAVLDIKMTHSHLVVGKWLVKMLWKVITTGGSGEVGKWLFFVVHCCGASAHQIFTLPIIAQSENLFKIYGKSSFSASEATGCWACLQ